MGCHNNLGSGYQSQFYWDFGPGFAFFGTNSRVDDSVSAYVTGQNYITDSLYSVIWPDFKYQEVPGQTPVTHVFAMTSMPEESDPRPMAYFRKVGANDLGDWDYPPYVVDTVFGTTYAQSVACSNIDGKMALVWIANRPDEGDADTASSQNGMRDILWDNDLYYQISNDYGATFSPRVNLTRNTDGEDGYRPFTDVSPLIDGNNDLHIAFNGRTWPADASDGGQSELVSCRMFHWGENLGTGGYDGLGDAIVRTAASLEWDQSNCSGGRWELNGSKMSLSECDGKLYYLWTQFNDPANGITDDCAARGGAGAANGELHVSISEDGGLTWCQSINLTNSYTPGCDSATGMGGPCESEHWPSMARFGTDIVGNNMSGAVMVDPTGVYTGGYYLDVQYVDDHNAGSAIEGEGSMQEADIRWMRLACIDPPSSVPPPVPWSLEYPAWTPHGVPLDTPLVLNNFGNVEMTFTLTTEEDTGPSGWLSTSGFESGVIPAGYDNSLEGVVTVNTGGIVNSPGTIEPLIGRLILTSNASSSPDTFPVECWVTDTLYLPQWDTIFAGGEASACLALTIGNNGNFGNQGIGHVNLDYFDYGDCDDLEGFEDTIPGMSEVYLYDGSPIICWTDETDTVRCNWSMYGDGYTSDHGFIPVGSVPVVEEAEYSVYETQFTTRDTGIMLEQKWIAPKTGECNWMIQILEVYALDGQAHTGLAIGEGMDWDIPSDSGLWNRSGFDDSRNLIYQYGSEFNDDPAECQDNSLRYGGIAVQGVDAPHGDVNGEAYGAYTRDNSQQVYPEGSFVPDSLWKYMANDNYSISDSVDADLHTVATFLWDYDLAPTDTIRVYMCLVTGKDGETHFLASVDECLQWGEDQGLFPDLGCCVMRGDLNHDGVIDIDDLRILVEVIFGGGLPWPYEWEDLCWDEFDIDASGVAPVDIGDLVWLVDYMFTGGPEPPPC